MMYQPIPATMQYTMLIANIEQGLIKIPQFQRQFVWSIEQSAKLLDSILKGYPIGSFILWETKERLRSIRNIGQIKLPDTPAGVPVQYVLDGQQRMTSLYVAMKGACLSDEYGRITDYSQIYVDFEAKEDEQIIVTDVAGREETEWVRFTDLLTGGYALAAKYPSYLDKLDAYSNAFKTYLFSVIQVKDAPIDVATEIFTRINVGGKSLSVFEIMAAKTYDSVRGFDLAEQYEKLIGRLESVNYETIPSSTVLQAVSVCLVKECSKKRILNLERNAFIDVWDKVIDALEQAVDYFRSFYRIPVSQLLPYDGLLIPFTYFFYHYQKRPLDGKERLLQDYFWRVVLNSRFSTALETKVGQDIKRMDLILDGQRPTYEEPVDISVNALTDRGWFSTGVAYIKGFLCLLAYQQPESFVDGALVTINNSWLKQANSKNYHHFFPRAFMTKHCPDVEAWRVNHIANITIVDDFLNKRLIRDKAPSDYIAEYEKKNPNLKEVLATHLIGDPHEWGIDRNDYALFFARRLDRYRAELQKRLLLTPSDRM